jgi:polar amino acid transport system substrate-binding protein
MKLTKKIAAVTALTLSLSATMAHAEDVLRIATEGAFPPFNYTDSSGEITGFDVEIGMAICERMQRECEVVAQEWDGIIPGLLANNYDLIVASMFITEERKEKVSFSDSYYLAAMSFTAPKDANITDFSAEALSGLTFGAQVSTTQSAFIEAEYPDADLRLYGSQDEANLDMASGRIDIMVGDSIPSLDWVNKTDDGKCCEVVGDPIIDPKYVGDGVGIAVRKEETELLAAVNAALAEVIADGTYDVINDKYFDIDIRTMKAR